MDTTTVDPAPARPRGRPRAVGIRWGTEGGEAWLLPLAWWPRPERNRDGTNIGSGGSGSGSDRCDSGCGGGTRALNARHAQRIPSGSSVLFPPPGFMPPPGDECPPARGWVAEHRSVCRVSAAAAVVGGSADEHSYTRESGSRLRRWSPLPPPPLPPRRMQPATLFPPPV